MQWGFAYRHTVLRTILTKPNHSYRPRFSLALDGFKLFSSLLSLRLSVSRIFLFSIYTCGVIEDKKMTAMPHEFFFVKCYIVLRVHGMRTAWGIRLFFLIPFVSKLSLCVLEMHIIDKIKCVWRVIDFDYSIFRSCLLARSLLYTEESLCALYWKSKLSLSAIHRIVLIK